jgi:16S rRNA (adenine1518-N6/adenine1519-N6)-dimethyltransferase
MLRVKPKKRLGQHFLKDEKIALDIVEALSPPDQLEKVIEIGPGTGVLSGFLIEKNYKELSLLDVDKESIDFLLAKYGKEKAQILHEDFLKIEVQNFSKKGQIGIIGNFPYNISSQIFFKVLDNKDEVSEVVCMLQKEVAERIVSKHGNKTYGILSVLLQAFYDIEYLFTVEPNVFIPPPKVRSAVIRLKRNKVENLGCDEKLFKRVIKQAFQTRRKTLRNALKPLNLSENIIELDVFNKRAEQLSVSDFVDLTNKIYQ